MHEKHFRMILIASFVTLGAIGHCDAYMIGNVVKAANEVASAALVASMADADSIKSDQEHCVAKGGQRCAFPVKYKGETYTTCGKNGYTKNWCPTSLKTSGEYEEWDLCSPARCTVNTGCTTIQGADPGADCVFPFTYGEVVYNACTTDGGAPLPWCSTLTDENGVHVGQEKWGYCALNCPIEADTA